MSNNFTAYNNVTYGQEAKFENVNNDNNYPDQYAMQADNQQATVVVQDGDLTVVVTSNIAINVHY